MVEWEKMIFGYELGRIRKKAVVAYFNGRKLQ
jgi:hypothetical protein